MGTEIGKKLTEAHDLVKNLNVTESEQLDLYGLYQQATGDFRSHTKPAFWQISATREYWAWEKERDKFSNFFEFSSKT